MEVEEVERQLRKQLEERVGRPLSDEEWVEVKRAAAENGTKSSAATSAGNGGGAVRAVGSIVEGTTSLLKA